MTRPDPFAPLDHLAARWQQAWENPPQKWRHLLARTVPTISLGAAAAAVRAAVTEARHHPSGTPAAAGADRLAEALADAASWLNDLAEHGPDLRIHAHIKTAHEAQELAADPSVDEAADVLICIVGTALQRHWSTEELADAVAAKVAVNRARTWAQQPDGTWRHTPTPAREGEQ